MTRVHEAGEVELVLDARAEVGEGPVWDVARSELVWVDIPRGLVHRLDPATGRDEPLPVQQPVGAVGLRESGGLVLAVRDGFGLLDAGSREVRIVQRVESDRPNNRMNDGKCDRAGRFWAGTMALDETPRAGALYRLETDLQVRQVVRDATMPNGLDWSLDDRTLYYVDSVEAGIDIFDYDPTTADLADRRRLVDIAPTDGLPDGLTVDAQGFLWVALWGGSHVRRYTPDGRLDAVVELPVTQVTSCTFGGAEMDELYVTTAAAGLDGDALRREPHAGGIFRFRPGCRGRATRLFGG
ncbi:MAG: SMP-30/gluconolactonase/LRE family protein [Nocardioidaceae bacterium]